MELNREEGGQLFSALRSSPDQIEGELELISTQKIFTEIFGSICGIGAIINKNRQIIFANDEFIKSLDLNDISSVLGKRPGEILSCNNADNCTGGCGTSAACRVCGALNAITESQHTGQKSSREAFITTRVNGKIKALDLKITSVPISLSGNIFYALVIQDISHEKRRAALERIFFHDLLNSAGVLNGLLSLLKEGVAPDKERQMINMSEEASREIVDEIQAHRYLLAAENGELTMNILTVSTLKIISDSVNKIAFHKSGNNKKILIAEKTEDLSFETDKVILERVLINLLKNALEATPERGQVLIGAYELNDGIRFWVKNHQFIPKDIQMQLFQRSFSTKGTGRGLGTYSIRLLTENYLKGSVSFVSNEKEGTVFEVKVNKKA